MEAEARARGVTGPICFATDGHASRFFQPVLEWIHEKDTEGNPMRDLYITPPNATGTLCWLDQLFQHLHRSYGDKITELKRESVGGLTMRIDKYEAVSAVCAFWRTWATEKAIIRAKRVCGFDEEGRWSVDTIPKENFMISQKYEDDIASSLARCQREAPSWAHLDVDSSFDSSGTEASTLLSPSQAPLKLLPMTGFPTPDPTVFSDKGSLEYFEEKTRLFKCVIEAQRGPPRTAIGEGVVRVCWYEAKHTNKTNCERLTAVHGSMLASDLINLQREKIRKEDEAVAAKGDYQADLRAKYDKCKGGCTCTETSCQAKGLFLCMSCQPLVGVMKKQICQVKKCIAARSVVNAMWSPPLPNKPSAPKRQKRVRREAEVSSDYGDDDAEEEERQHVQEDRLVCFPDYEDGGRISDVPDFSSESEEEGDKSEGHDSDDDEPAYLHAFEKHVNPNVHYKTYPWQNGSFYKVFWVQEKKWLTGQCVRSNTRGVTLYYASDDTDAIHLYKDNWHIIEDTKICEVTVHEPVIN